MLTAEHPVYKQAGALNPIKPAAPESITAVCAIMTTHNRLMWRWQMYFPNHFPDTGLEHVGVRPLAALISLEPLPYLSNQRGGAMPACSLVDKTCLFFSPTTGSIEPPSNLHTIWVYVYRHGKKFKVTISNIITLRLPCSQLAQNSRRLRDANASTSHDMICKFFLLSSQGKARRQKSTMGAPP